MSQIPAAGRGCSSKRVVRLFASIIADDRDDRSDLSSSTASVEKIVFCYAKRWVGVQYTFEITFCNDGGNKKKKKKKIGKRREWEFVGGIAASSGTGDVSRITPVTAKFKERSKEGRRTLRCHTSNGSIFLTFDQCESPTALFRIDGSVIGSLRVLQDSQQGARNLFTFKDFLFWYVGLTRTFELTRKEFLIRSLFLSFLSNLTSSIGVPPQRGNHGEFYLSLSFLSTEARSE
ncbi:hypothetical protein K0M31_000765 [Melipona bicolor]|uniref:Uncharacterized protein n=1 Tax=Melipona bicolor TaxID=60889 RepID=A0AA40GED9_9HYME|nr:hypothetical protein K0M31_000765 [Melipona bicolor]